jgi:hypothetical protein
MADPFQYEPFSKPWLFRIVVMLPREDDDEVRCDLKTIPGGDAEDYPDFDPADNDKKIPYEALSYTWGESIPQHAILLNGKRFFVGTNLYVFLKQWRPEAPMTRSIWIDAICINQNDLEEKSSQIPRMRTIYQHAKSIAIWVGQAADDSDLVMDEMTALEKRVREARRPGEIDQALFPRLRDDESWILFDHNLTHNNRIYKAIRRLLNRPWWSRVWVTQEVTSPNKDAWFLCGDRWIYWNSILNFYGLILAFAHTDPLLSKVVGSVEFWTIRMSRQMGGVELKLLNLLVLVRDFQASNPRDRVYAVLGITSDLLDNSFPSPNYKKSVRSVYRGVAKYLISASPYRHKLDILGHTDDVVYHQLPDPSTMNLFAKTANTPGPVQWALKSRGLEHFDFPLDLNDQALNAPSYEAFQTTAKNWTDSLSHLPEMLKRSIDLTAWGLEHSQGDGPLPELSSWPSHMQEIVENADLEMSDEYWQDMLNILDYLKFQTLFESLGNYVNPEDHKTLAVLGQDGTQSLALARDELAKLIESHDPPVSVIDESLWPNRSVWPSWLPDWRYSSASSTPFLKSLNPPNATVKAKETLWELGVYAVSGHGPGVFTRPSGSDEDFVSTKNELHLRGFKVDTVKICKLLELDDETWDNEAHMFKISECVPTEVGQVYPVTGEDIFDAFQRTVMADIIYQGNFPVARGNRMSSSDSAADDQSSIYDPSPAIFNACHERFFAITEGSLMGLVPKSSRVGDEIFVLEGGQVFYVLRPFGECFKYVGECYLHGLMDGEALKRLEDGTAKVCDIRLA